MSESLPDPSPRAVAVVGPTASGKGQLGRRLALELELPILVCDSVKVYRGLDIGSAKPSPSARAEVPHHLIDLVDPDQRFSSGDYARHAWDVFRRTSGIFVGGTGLYLRAAAFTHTGEALSGVATPADDAAREAFDGRWLAMEQATPGAAHQALRELDPATAATIHPNNLVRVIRALWLCEVHGVAVSRARRDDPPRPRMRLLMIVMEPDPQDLDRRIEARIDAMLQQGWLGEVEKLHEAGYDARHKAMRSLGYRQLLDVVEGRMGQGAAREAIRIATRQYARRQRTYFRHQIPADDVIRLTNADQCPIERVRAHLGARGSQ